jgi:glutathione synthase/RimK-type ligase-like ATP-grasp enzyme
MRSQPKPHSAKSVAEDTILGDDLEKILHRARRLAAAGQNEDAYASYLEFLRRMPSHPAALHELGGLAHAKGHRSAARSIYGKIVHLWPQDPIGHINLGNILCEDGDLALAEQHFLAAIAIRPDAVDAHRGLAQLLSDRGEISAAGRHWRLSFPEQAITTQPYRGAATAVPVLLLISSKGGNIPTRNILDTRIFFVAVLYAEYYKSGLPLPPHALIFNAIGDADLCTDALAIADAIVARSGAPVINQPARVLGTGRAANAACLATVPGVRAPDIRVVSREALAGVRDMAFPLLLRAQGFHTGQHFLKVERQEDLATAAATLPGDNLLLIEYLEARGADGLARKYRVMCIGGALYPMHLAISGDWKVHYFTADMAANATHRAEERQFLEDMPAVLGARALAALTGIGTRLALDYLGIDFALGDDGAVLLFEANATMVINPPSAEPIWDYRRASIGKALQAAQQLLRASAL